MPTINPRELFEAYRTDRLDKPIEGFDLDRLPRLRRHLPHSEGEALLCFARLTPGQEDAQIAEQIALFGARRQGFEWKVYEYDSPADLKPRLEAHGLLADEGECFMLYPLKQDRAGARRVTPPPGVEIRRITDPAQLGDVLAVQAQVWGRDFAWLHDRLARNLAEPERMSMFCAYAEGRPIGSGWTDYPAGSSFPELHGGAVVAAWRARGVYSSLFDCRFDEARARGHAWMAVDASSMSEPILQRMGFVSICRTWPLRHAGM